MTATVSEMLSRAAALLDKGVCRGANARLKGGKACGVFDQRAASYSMYGALCAVLGPGLGDDKALQASPAWKLIALRAWTALHEERRSRMEYALHDLSDYLALFVASYSGQKTYGRHVPRLGRRSRDRGDGRVAVNARLTLQEAAAELGTKERWLNDWLRAHPRDDEGEPFYTPVGRDKVFHHTDITRIERALRGGVPCHSSSGRRAPVRRRTTKSEAPISESAWKRAAELTSDPSLSTRSSSSRSASSDTASTQRPNLHLVQGSPRS